MERFLFRVDAPSRARSGVEYAVISLDDAQLDALRAGASQVRARRAALHRA